MKLNKKIIKAIEKEIPDIGITDEGKYYSVYVDNPCGQDFSYEITKGENEIEDLLSCCDNYDAEDEFRTWYGANRGEPSCPGDLWENCEEIGETLKELSLFLQYDVLNS